MVTESLVLNTKERNNLNFLPLHFPLRAEIFNLQLLSRARKAFKASIGSTLKPLTEQTFAFFVESIPRFFATRRHRLCAIEMPTKFHAAKSNTPPEEVTHTNTKAPPCYASPHDLPARQKVYMLTLLQALARSAGRGASLLKLSGCLSVCAGVCVSERTRIALLGAKRETPVQAH